MNVATWNDINQGYNYTGMASYGIFEMRWNEYARTTQYSK